MKSDDLLIAHIEDKIDQADDRYMLSYGDFLDTHQRRVVTDYCRGRRLPVQMIMYGGYEDAERCLPVFLPDYLVTDDDSLPEEVCQLLKLIRVSAAKGSRTLTHRDYLGSLLALGIEREVTGDILVRKEESEIGPGADIIVLADMAEYIELNYSKAGHVNLKVEVLPLSELNTGKPLIEKKHDTVASLRLDSIVSSAFGLSRAKAAEAIRRGIVSVNSMEAVKIDMEIHEADKIVMRGRGKVVLAEIAGKSRKDRTRVIFDIYS